MNTNPTLRTLLAMLLLAGFANAQEMHGPPVGKGLGPLLFVRFSGPEGSKITFYQGQAAGREFPAPVSVGLRPGYPYRMKMTGFGEAAKGQALYPTLEVRNTLALPPNIPLSRFPAPIILHPEEVDRILSGAFITKVIYLENPDLAVPRSTTKEELIESTVTGATDPIEEA